MGCIFPHFLFPNTIIRVYGFIFNNYTLARKIYKDITRWLHIQVQHIYISGQLTNMYLFWDWCISSNTFCKRKIWSFNRTFIINVDCSLYRISSIVGHSQFKCAIFATQIWDWQLVPRLFFGIQFNISTPYIRNRLCTHIFYRSNCIWFYDNISCCFDTHIAVEVAWEACFNLIKQSFDFIHRDSIYCLLDILFDFLCWDIFFAFFEQCCCSTHHRKHLVIVI